MKVSLDELTAMLDVTPVIADIDPVSTVYLPNDVIVWDSLGEAVWKLDEGVHVFPSRWLITDLETSYLGRFPIVECDHNPFTEKLNTILFDHFDQIAERMLCQSNLPDYIVAVAAKTDILILILVDGLSYENAHNWANVDQFPTSVRPCLVDVPSVTRIAFPNAIGSPNNVAQRLFDLGFRSRIGFTYWEREDNKLTDQLFRGIGQTHKLSYFPEIIDKLRDFFSQHDAPQKTFIQIVRTGLDGFAHGQKRKAPVSAVIMDVYNELELVNRLCEELYDRFKYRIKILLTSDHGLLWQDEFIPTVVGSAPPQSSARWCDWRDLHYQEENGRRFIVGNQDYYCLGYPKLRRPLKMGEQAVHGGISFQESIVPFVEIGIGE